MVSVEFVLVSISFYASVAEAVEADNCIPGPNPAQADATVEILTSLEEECAIIEAITNNIRLPDILAWVLLGRPEDNDVGGD